MSKKNTPLTALQFGLSDYKFMEGQQDTARKFSGTAYSGLPIMNHPFWGNLIFDTSSISSEPIIPVLFNHDAGRIVGQGSIRVNGAIFIDGTISKSTDDGRMVEELLDEGFPMKESVYIQPARVDKFEAGSTFSVNGQELEGPFTVFRDSVIKEVSMTPLPADINTGTQIFNENLNKSIEIEEVVVSDAEIKEEVKEEPKEEVKEETEGKLEGEDSKEDESKQEGPKEEEKPEPKEEAKEEPKEEVEPAEDKPADELPEDERKFMDLVSAGDLRDAFAFACGCESKSKRAGESDLDKLQKKFDELLKKYNDLKSKAKKDERFSEIEASEEKSGVKFSQDAKSALLALDDKAFAEVVSGVKAQTKRKLDPRLFSEAKKSDSQVETIEFDENSPASIQEAARKFADAKAKQGIKMNTHEAVLEVLKTRG
jgi:hypothetical protein